MPRYEITSEELYAQEELKNMYIFCTMADLPCATYIGNDEWIGVDGKHYIVMGA